MKKVKQGRMLLMLPVLIIPFLTMGFWALGGGSAKKQIAENVKGLNPDLPASNLKDDKAMDKLSFYDAADKDSMKMEEWMRSDPYFKKDSLLSSEEPSALEELGNSTATKYNQHLNVSSYDVSRNNPEEKLLQQLKLLQDQMNNHNVTSYENPVIQHSKDDLIPGDIQPSEPHDADMDQLNGTLEKILDVQHPERVKERLKEKSLQHKGVTYPVTKQSITDTIVRGFYSCSDEKEIAEATSVEAVVQENQNLVNGSVVKFRLVNAIYIDGKLVPEGSFVYGIAALDGERLLVEINSIRSATNLFNVKLSVYDMDGLPGIYIPGAINRDVAKQSADNGLTMLEMGTVDPSLKAKSATAGIGAVKNLLSKKAKLTRVLVKAGYQVLLKDKNNEQ